LGGIIWGIPVQFPLTQPIRFSAGPAAWYLDAGTSAVISFPTGAGKSTLSELKIAATLQTGKKVIYLVPTHALAAQMAQSLAEANPDAKVQRSLILDGEFADIDADALPQIAVMTPEKCLALVSMVPEAFEDVGLLTFDECHLLHPSRGLRDRRSIDAMLCLLFFISSVPASDIVLISAMMENADELSGWPTTSAARMVVSRRSSRCGSMGTSLLSFLKIHGGWILSI
jgi:replicative superfamily II helicase